MPRGPRSPRLWLVKVPPYPSRGFHAPEVAAAVREEAALPAGHVDRRVALRQLQSDGLPLLDVAQDQASRLKLFWRVFLGVG